MKGRRTMVMRSLVTAALVLAAAGGIVAVPVGALAQDLVLYGAGSLRRSMSEIAQTFGAANGLTVKTEFGFSGRMRERIEAGDKVDVFTSANMGHPMKLMADGRAVTLAMFARNALCLLSPERVGPVTPDTALDVLLRDVKIGMWPPVSDPLGDYTVKLFALANTIRTGSGAVLQSRAVILHTSPTSPSGDDEVDALVEGRADVVIAYCSAASSHAAASKKVGVTTTLTAFPAALTVGPEYGLVVLKDARPQAAALALFILSPQGQKILQQHGFVPIALPSE
jgi:molybdate transport system substrate-binding protein